MAAVALNKFITVRKKATRDIVGIYTCPIGVAAIVTLCNVTNVSSGVAASTYSITAMHSRPNQGDYKFANNEVIPVDDSMNLIPDGRLALETNDVLKFQSNGNEQLDIILSILETAKQ